MEKLRLILEAMQGRRIQRGLGEDSEIIEALVLLQRAEEENAKRFGDCLNCEYRTVATAEMTAEKQLTALRQQVREWAYVMGITQAYIGNGEIVKRINTAVAEMRKAVE